MKVNEKTIVVTGAGSGIGRELSLLLLNKNATVVGIDLNHTTLLETQKLAATDNSRFLPIEMDISDKAKCETLPDEIFQHFKNIDGLINNAGIIQKFIPVLDLGFEDIFRVMNINFYGTVFLTKILLPHLLRRSEAHIVNISSMGGFLPVPGQTIYGASKAAVKLFTEGLSAELKDTSVHVTVIFPGAVATNISVNSGLEVPPINSGQKSKFKALPADEAARQIINSMETNKYRATIGNDARTMDWMYRFNPKFAAEPIQRKMASLIKIRETIK